MKRDILFLTGTRADFGKLEPLAKALLSKGHNLSFFVTGMHMMEVYGLTKIEVQRMPGVEVHEFLNHRTGDGQDICLAKTIVGFSDYIQENRPELIVIHGDRIEALAGAIVAAVNNIPCAHVEGGEVSGTIDEALRHSNTKLATHHFVSSQRAAKRVIAMGEPKGRVHVIGSPELDVHALPSGVSLDEVRQRYDITAADYGICVFHPVTSEQASIGAQAKAFFDALTASGRAFVVIAPNNDPGSEAIFDVLDNLPKEQFRILPSMRFAYFSELLKNAACIVGNSSAGVREAPFLGVASLNVGTRQANRTDVGSVIHCDAFDRHAIEAFLSQNWDKKCVKDTTFGEGDAAQKFAAVLALDEFWSTSTQKAFQDDA